MPTLPPTPPFRQLVRIGINDYQAGIVRYRYQDQGRGFEGGALCITERPVSGTFASWHVYRLALVEDAKARRGIEQVRDFLTGFILIIGLRAALSIPRYPRYSGGWILRTLLLTGLYLVFSLCGMIVMVRLGEALLPSSLTDDQVGLLYLGGWILWMTTGTIGLIRLNRMKT